MFDLARIIITVFTTAYFKVFMVFNQALNANFVNTCNLLKIWQTPEPARFPVSMLS